MFILIHLQRYILCITLGLLMLRCQVHQAWNWDALHACFTWRLGRASHGCISTSHVFFSIILFLLSIFGQNVLCDLHEFIQSLLVQFLCKTTNNLLCALTVNSNTKAHFQNHQQGFHVDESGLVDWSDWGLFNVVFHSLQLLAQACESLERVGAWLSIGVWDIGSMEIFIKQG